MVCTINARGFFDLFFFLIDEISDKKECPFFTSLQFQLNDLNFANKLCNGNASSILIYA